MLERRLTPGGAVVFHAPVLAALGVPHAFTTRIGERGEEDSGSLAPADAARLRERVGVPGAALFAVRQVHGCDVVVVGGDEEAGELAADAVVTERPDRLLAIQTADCVPVLLATADGRRVAAVHAGWRGLVAGVLPRALEALGGEAHAAAIGPSICARCFEVGDEVVEAFERAELGAAVLPAERGGRAHVDLRAAAALQLERGGVPRVDETDRCTYEHARELWSHRRDVTHGGRAKTGRQLALAATRRG